MSACSLTVAPGSSQLMIVGTRDAVDKAKALVEYILENLRDQRRKEQEIQALTGELRSLGVLPSPGFNLRSFVPARRGGRGGRSDGPPLGRPDSERPPGGRPGGAGDNGSVVGEAATRGGRGGFGRGGLSGRAGMGAGVSGVPAGGVRGSVAANGANSLGTAGAAMNGARTAGSPATPAVATGTPTGGESAGIARGSGGDRGGGGGGGGGGGDGGGRGGGGIGGGGGGLAVERTKGVMVTLGSGQVGFRKVCLGFTWPKLGPGGFA
jgi:hypothetical protein